MLKKIFHDFVESTCLNNRKIILSGLRKLTLSCCFVFTFVSVSFSQTITVTGRVQNELLEPLEGATVGEKNSGNITATDKDGNYRITVAKNAMLVFSFVGLSSQEIFVSGRTAINITLTSNQNQLNDVVVVGYGTQRKSKVPGAIASVSGTDIVKSPAVSATNGLIGRAAGVIAVQRSGEPGNDVSDIFIRGIGTTGDASPIYVIDGIVSSRSNFAQINANEIENISILKDAASAAVFGVRGGNGIILVTTKRGRSGKASFSFNVNYGIQKQVRVPEYVNSYEYASFYNQALENGGRPLLYTDDQLQKIKDGSDPLRYANTNWNEATIRENSPLRQSNLSLLGGNDKVKYAVNLGYTDQSGIYRANSSGFKRYNFRSNLDADVTNTTRISFDLSGRNENRRAPVASIDRIFEALSTASPLIVAQYPNGYFGQPFTYNPILLTRPEEGYNRQTSYTLVGRMQLLQQIPFVTGLSLKGVIGVDKSFGNQKIWNAPFFKTYRLLPDSTFQEARQPTPPSLNEYYSDGKEVTVEGHLNYENTFGNHSISGLVLYTQTETDFNNISANRSQYLLRIDELNFGPDLNKSNGGISGGSGRRGVVGRINYTYNDKYTIESSFRADASEQFAPGKRWGYFPSVSGSWLLSKEKFVANIHGIDYLKLRGSWGVLGNDRLGADRFLYLASYFSGGYAVFGDNQLNQVIYEGRIANPDVTWERIRKLNIGVDLGLMKNNLTVELDVFYDKRNSILGKRNTSVPALFGIDLPVENFAKVDNKGIELAINYRNTISTKARFNVKGNITYVRNKIIDIDEPASTNPNIKLTGRPLGTQFGLQAIGIFQSDEEIQKAPIQGGVKPGDIRYADINGDNVIDGNDRTDIGKSNIPEIIYGLTPEIHFGGFDFSLLLQGATRVSQYYSQDAAWPFYSGGSALKTQLDAWTPSNPGASQPRVLLEDNQNRLVSSFWMKNNSYLRIRNAELAYNVATNWLDKVGAKSFRVYINANNLFTFSKLKDFDPENSSDRGWAYPQLLIINFGAGINF
jgi:TonB-linked SusC/RagA family outer membrane protein